MYKQVSEIEEYLRLVRVCVSVNYADKKAIEMHSKAVDKMYKLVKEIGTKQLQETIGRFVELLDVNENKTNVWAAVHMLEEIPVQNTIKEKPLKIVELQAVGNTVEAMGFKILLNNYVKGKNVTL